jgi:hypothetical protein
VIASSFPLPAAADVAPVAGVDAEVDDAADDGGVRVLGAAMDGDDALVLGCVVGAPPVAELLHPVTTMTPTNVRPAPTINLDINTPFGPGQKPTSGLAALRIPVAEAAETNDLTLLRAATDRVPIP